MHAFISKLWILFCLGGMMMLAACAVPPTPTADPAAAAPAGAPQATLPPGVILQVIRPDGSAFPFTLKDLGKLPLAQLTVESKVEEGPKISDILAAAGVTSYTAIHLDGSSSPADLTRAQVENGAMLDFNNHGTVKLSSVDIPKPQWTKDVNRIEVR